MGSLKVVARWCRTSLKYNRARKHEEFCFWMVINQFLPIRPPIFPITTAPGFGKITPTRVCSIGRRNYVSLWQIYF